VVDIDHVEPHLLGEQRIILGDLLHLGQQGPRERYYLVRPLAQIIKIFHRRNDGNFLGERFFYPEALDGGNENIYRAVGQVYAFYDFGDRPDLMQIRHRGSVQWNYLQLAGEQDFYGYDLVISHYLFLSGIKTGVYYKIYRL